MVESFLDSYHNPQAPPQHPKLRQEVANLLLSNLGDDLFESFLASLRSADRTACRAVGARLARLLELHPEDCVNALGRVIRAGLDDFYFFAEDLEGVPARFNRPNPLVHLFVPLLNRVHRHLESLGQEVDVVADEDAQC